MRSKAFIFFIALGTKTNWFKSDYLTTKLCGFAPLSLCVKSPLHLCVQSIQLLQRLRLLQA